MLASDDEGDDDDDRAPHLWPPNCKSLKLISSNLSFDQLS